MPMLDPATGTPLPDSAIQRVLHLTPAVHIYQIPPLTSSTAGFSAGSWTAPPRPTAQKIFTARLRVLETAHADRIKADIVFEDASSGALFAAAPYLTPAVVQQANDSSRFFAVRVQGEGGMKATLGIGFEDRSEAFDFGVALGEVRKVLGMEGVGGKGRGKVVEKEVKQDFSLREGEKIHIQVGGKGRRQQPLSSESGEGKKDDGTALFSIAPPPAGAKSHDGGVEAEADSIQGKTAEELGFDDGEFGEFQ
ncbi:unnamed protein product [Zymoseptoria tritici ST99CH_3D1]|nr:unnamed protein product [Zymoseptoria tritici ST99CH_3D1]